MNNLLGIGLRSSVFPGEGRIFALFRLHLGYTPWAFDYFPGRIDAPTWKEIYHE